jgi:hypothetical protein
MAFTAMLLALFPAFYIATRREGAHYKELEHAAGRAFPAAPARADSSKERVPSAVPASHGSLVAEMINEKYGVQVVMKDERYPVKLYSGLIRATDAQSPDLDRYCTVLAQEFLLYPPGLIRRSRLTKIVLCRALSYNG